MQERQQTTTSNVYYDLVSVLYHALQSAQTSAAYIQDAEQAGQQQVVMFFRQLQQDANSQAEQAREQAEQAREAAAAAEAAAEAADTDTDDVDEDVDTETDDDAGAAAAATAQVKTEHHDGGDHESD